MFLPYTRLHSHLPHCLLVKRLLPTTHTYPRPLHLAPKPTFSLAFRPPASLSPCCCLDRHLPDFLLIPPKGTQGIGTHYNTCVSCLILKRIAVVCRETWLLAVGKEEGGWTKSIGVLDTGDDGSRAGEWKGMMQALYILYLPIGP